MSRQATGTRHSLLDHQYTHSDHLGYSLAEPWSQPVQRVGDSTLIWLQTRPRHCVRVPRLPVGLSIGGRIRCDPSEVRHGDFHSNRDPSAAADTAHVGWGGRIVVQKRFSPGCLNEARAKSVGFGLGTSVSLWWWVHL